jgi:hypothetical protein
MVLLEDGSKIDELLDATQIGLRLQSASQRSEVNLSLVADDGSYLAVSIGSDTQTQLIYAASSLAAPSVCTTSPLPIDRVISVFRGFLGGDPQWRSSVDWLEGDTETAVQAAHEHSRRARTWIVKQYVRALVVIPIVALVATGGDLPKSFAIAWLPVTLGAFVKIIFFCYGKGLPAARGRVGKALDVSLYYHPATGMYQEFSGWKIDGEAPAWKHLAVFVSMFSVIIALTLVVLVSVGLIASIGTWVSGALEASGL